MDVQGGRIMKRIAYYGLALAMAGTLASSPVHADKPSWAGGGDRQEKGKGHSRERDHDRDRSHSAHRDEGHFRTAIASSSGNTT